MRRNRLIRIAAGAAIWLVLLFALASALALSSGHPGGSVARRLYRHSIEGPTRVEVRLPSWALCPEGTRVVVPDGPAFVAIGEVTGSRTEPGAIVALADVAPERGDRIGPRTTATLLMAPGTAAWITKTLVPPDTALRIRREIDALRVTHEADIVRTLRPFVRETVDDAASLLARDFRAALERHRGEIEAILDRYRVETLEKEFVPVFREHVWPTVVDLSRPALEEIARELWEKLPLWSLGWSWAYGKLPRTPADALEQRFNRFLQEEAIPLLRERQDELARTAESVVRAISENPEVRDVVRRAAERVASDPELEALLRHILEEVVTDNEALARLLERRWNDPRVQRAMQGFSARLQPGIDRIINMVLLNEAGDGISPHLARVLRTEILRKDTIWIRLDPAPGDARPAGAAPVVLEGRVDTDG